MSRAIPAGGQITPFDWARLSLSGPELPPPTVGGSPLTSGGHVTPCRGTCSRSAAPAPHLPVRSQRTLQWSEWSGAKGNSSHTCMFVNVPRRNTFPPPTSRGSVQAFDVCAKSGCRLWERGDSIWRELDERRSLGPHDGWLDPNRREITRGQQRYRGSRCGRWRRWYRRGPAAHGRAC